MVERLYCCTYFESTKQCVDPESKRAEIGDEVDERITWAEIIKALGADKDVALRRTSHSTSEESVQPPTDACS